MWSTAGCRTVQRNGTAVCECNHLSDFIAVKRPTLNAETVSRCTWPGLSFEPRRRRLDHTCNAYERP